MISKINSKKCKKIKLVITDVDGVLTDGGMYYSEKGEIMKKFNTKDGMAVELLHKNSIKTVFLTKENSKITKSRAKKVKADGVYVNIKDKEKYLSQICKKFAAKPNEILYIGDDINDIGIIKKSGFSSCPNNAIHDVKKIVDHICKTNGGEGVLREITEIIIKYKN